MSQQKVDGGEVAENPVVLSELMSLFIDGLQRFCACNQR